MKSRKIKSIKIRNKKNKTKTKKQKQRKSRFFAGGPKEDDDLSRMEEGRIKGKREDEDDDEDEESGKKEYILDDMEQGKLPQNYLLKEIKREREKEEKNKRIKLANIPLSAFAQKTEKEKKIDAFHEWKAAQNLKYLNVVKNNEQYLKYNPTESLRERESAKPVTVYATIDPETGEPINSHKDPDIRPLNLHGEHPGKNDDYGFYAHDFDGGKTKRKRKRKRNKRQRKNKTRRSIPSRK